MKQEGCKCIVSRNKIIAVSQAFMTGNFDNRYLETNPEASGSKTNVRAITAAPLAPQGPLRQIAARTMPPPATSHEAHMSERNSVAACPAFQPQSLQYRRLFFRSKKAGTSIASAEHSGQRIFTIVPLLQRQPVLFHFLLLQYHG